MEENINNKSKSMPVSINKNRSNRQEYKQDRDNRQESNRQNTKENTNMGDSVKNALKLIWARLNRLKSKLGFQTLSDEFGTFMEIQDKYIRNKSKASLDDSLMGEIESDMESLLGRLEVYDELDTNEVKMLKGVEKPLTIFGKKIELGNYKKVSRIVMYAGGFYIGYVWILKPVIFPLMKKVLTAKVRKNGGSGNSNSGVNGVKDADFRVI